MNTQQPLPFLNFSVTSELHIVTNAAQFPIAVQKNPPAMSPTVTNATTCTKSSTDERRETIDIRTLLLELHQIQQQTSFAVNGYRMLHKMCNTLQGQLYKAQRLSTDQYVAIKKTEKSLYDKHVTIQDEVHFCVAEDILKEALIQKHLTVDNTPIGDHIIKYIDFFVDDTAYYLVTEYIESEMNLKQFVARAHEYIAAHKLQIKRYQQAMKYVLWQLMVTIRWMHDDMHCCHLDLCLENTMLTNCEFKPQKDGSVTINPSISVKLGDFGVAEIFENVHMNRFICNKVDLSVDCAYFAPNVRNETAYDARCADMWSLGMIMFEALSGEPLYDPMEVFSSECSEFETSWNGYSALQNGDLKKYLLAHKTLKYFNANSMQLLLNLLCIDEAKRFRAVNVLQHPWFNMYFKRYHKQIERKSITQKQRLRTQKKSMNVPFYNWYM